MSFWSTLKSLFYSKHEQISVKEHEDKRPSAHVTPTVARTWTHEETMGQLRAFGDLLSSVDRSLGIKQEQSLQESPQKPTVLRRDASPGEQQEKPSAKPTPIKMIPPL